MKNAMEHARIEITAGTITRAILLVIAALAVFALKDIILVVLTAVVIASAMEPGIVWFIKRGIPRIFSALVMYAIVGSLLLGAFYTVVPRILQDTSQLLSSVPRYIDTASLWNPLGSLTGSSAAPTAVPAISTGIQTNAQARLFDRATNPNPPSPSSIPGILDSIDQALNSVSAGFVTSAASVFGGVLSLILIVVLSFYLAVQEDGVELFLRSVVPDKHQDRVVAIWKKTQTKIGLWMQGQLVLAALVGVLVYLGLLMLGVKSALLFAVIAALLETIPLFGPIIAAIPAVAASYNDGGATAGLIVAILYLVIHQLENHLIYPLVVKKIVGVHPVVVILALLIGFKLAGFLGIILSVPVATLIIEMLDDADRRRKMAV